MGSYRTKQADPNWNDAAVSEAPAEMGLALPPMFSIGAMDQRISAERARQLLNEGLVRLRRLLVHTDSPR